MLGGGTDVPVRELLGRRSGEGREPAHDRTDVPREGVVCHGLVPKANVEAVALFLGVAV